MCIAGTLIKRPLYAAITFYYLAHFFIILILVFLRCTLIRCWVFVLPPLLPLHIHTNQDSYHH